MIQIIGLTCEEIELQEKSDIALDRLANQLYELADQYYVLENYQSFNNKLLFPELPGILVIYYIANKLVGFTRLARRNIVINEIEYATFYGGTYHTPDIQLNLHASRICLMQALRYKLFQPNHQLVYFANANNPQRFSFIREVSENVEPKEDGTSSYQVKQLMLKLCELNNWQFAPNNPQLIKKLVPLKPVWRNYNFPYVEEFKNMNPGFMDGDSLFMYIPLDMKTLGQCIHRSVADSHIIGGFAEYPERTA